MDESKNSFDRQTGRIEYIDIFRAFGIILMVMGHIGFGNRFDYFIHAFHMPMFFFVSGFLYKNRNIPFLSFLLKKAKTLLLPYFVFGLLHIIFQLFTNGFSADSIKSWLLFPTDGKMPIAGALWFLVALFFADILYFWADKIKNGRVAWVIVILISLVGQIVVSKLNMIMPFAFGAAMVGVGLIHIGRIFRLYERWIVDMRIYQIIFYSALTTLSIMLSSYINMRTGTYPKAFVLFWINAVAASILGLNIAKRMKGFFNDNFINRYLQSIGRNSIVYVCLNEIVILLCGKIVGKVLPFIQLSNGTNAFAHFLILIISLLVLYLLSLIFEKTIFRVLIGRFNKKSL